MPIRSALICWIVCSLLLLTISLWVSHRSLSLTLEPLIQTRLVPLLEQSVSNSFDLGHLEPFLTERINANLASLQASGHVQVLQRCQARVIALNDQQENQAGQASGVIQASWQSGLEKHWLKLDLSCQPSWLAAVLLAGGLAIAPALLILALPAPLSASQRSMLKQLSRYRLAVAPSATQLQTIEQFTALQWALFDRAQQQKMQLADAIAYATQEPQLIIRPRSRCVEIWSEKIELSSTPLLYYTWYAQLRLAGANGGWRINPPANRPDKDSADQLLHLLKTYQGNARAIRELEQNGLRARTLDQNRSKIKDELVGALGETLAEPFLFEVNRDAKNHRSAYRLTIPPQAIEIEE